MKHAVFVRICQGGGHRVNEVGAFVVCQDAAFDSSQKIREIHAVNVLHYEIGVVVVSFEIEHGNDVWVLKH